MKIIFPLLALKLRNRLSIPDMDKRLSSSFEVSRTDLRASKPTVHWVPGDLYQDIQRSGGEGGKLRPSRVEVMNEWSCTSAPSNVSMVSTGTL